MWIDAQGNIYFGDCLPGDRAATPAEVAAWEAVRNAPRPLQERIDAFVRTTSGGRVQNELQLDGLTAGLLGVHLASGGTETQLEASNSAYRQAKQLRAAVAAMRAQG